MDNQPQDYNEFLHKHKEVFYRYPLRLVQGIPLMEPIAQQWAPIENFQARPDDLLISTYPKAGTTWMQEIVDLVLVGGDVEKASRAPTHVRIPFLEICSPPPVPSGVSYLVDAPSPRVIKTHLPFQLVPKSFWENNCKTIYVARNAKDNVVSYFFFDQMNVTQPEPGPWDGYVKKFMEGKVAWGSWYDHVRRYWDEKENHRILYVFYEDMKEDLAREIRRVMKFLEVDLPEEVVQKIVHHTSFQVMKDNPMANYSSVPDVIFDKTKGTFMRKGYFQTDNLNRCGVEGFMASIHIFCGAFGLCDHVLEEFLSDISPASVASIFRETLKDIALPFQLYFLQGFHK